MSTLGIDVGTTGCKAAAYNLSGTCLGYAYREYRPVHPQPGWAELDSRQVWAAVQDVIRAVAAETQADPITALSVSALGEAMTPVDRSGAILGNCILSSDTRGAEYLEPWRERIDDAAFYRINPNILSPNYSLPKLLWLRDHRPEAFARADQFLLWGGLVARQLGCEAYASHSHANRTLLFDIHTGDWSDRLLDLAGLPRDLLPPCRPAGSLAGTVADGAAADLGLPKGVLVVVGGHDQCPNALGAGICRPGVAADGIGTYECITPVYEGIPDLEAMRSRGLNVEHHVVENLYVSFLYNQAGSLVRWFCDTFADGDHSPDRLAALEGEMPAGPSSVLVLPYFEPTGSPGYVNDASGVLFGLTLSTSRGEIYKGLLESITHYFHESLQALGEMGLTFSEYIATGGGARSDAWLQIKADILGTSVTRLSTTECGLLGCAMLAAVATRQHSSLEACIPLYVQRQRTFEPDVARHRAYAEHSATFRTLYPTFQDTLREWHQTCLGACRRTSATHAPRIASRARRIEEA